MKYKVKCYNIVYGIYVEDIDENYDIPTDLDEDDLEEWYDIKIAEIEKSLPKKVVVDVYCDDEDEFEEALVEALSDKTGWLIEDYEYDIIE